MSDHDTPSKIFVLRTRVDLGFIYDDRAVNMHFENEHMPLFKVVPPAVGSFIYLECKYRIDAIAYHNGKIVLYVSMAF